PPVAGVPGHLEERGVLPGQGHTVEHDRVVVRDQHPDHAGTQACAVTPPSSLRPMVRVPPTRPSRSAVDGRPSPPPPASPSHRPTPSSDTVTATPSRSANTLTTTD